MLAQFEPENGRPEQSAGAVRSRRSARPFLGCSGRLGQNGGSSFCLDLPSSTDRVLDVHGILSPIALAAVLSTWILTPLTEAVAQRPDTERWSLPRPRHEIDAGQLADFNFVRVQYDSEGGFNEAFYAYEGRIWQRWETDYPQADENFVFRLAELTSSTPNSRGLTRRLTDPDLFQFPFIYMCDVGWMRLSDEEARSLRNYLLRGGFLWVDDFWGRAEWLNFERNMRKVFPDRAWQEIHPGHEIFEQVFELDEVPQVPARDFFEMGLSHDPPYIHRYPAYGIEVPHLRGYFDDDGRLVAVATLNTDIGDGWEREGYGQEYFERFSTLSYALGVNIVVYALTH